MYTATLPNGQIIDAETYDKNQHGTQLCCPDDACSAPMNFRRGSITHGDQGERSPHFVSKDKTSHIKECNAYEIYQTNREQRKFTAALTDPDMRLILNLNMDISPLTHEFNRKAAPSFQRSMPQWMADSYAVTSIDNIYNLLHTLENIEEKGDATAFDRTFVNFRGHAIPLDKFIVEKDSDKMKKLVRNLYQRQAGEVLSSMKNTATPLPAEFNEKSSSHILRSEIISGYPRLFVFKPTENAKKLASKHLNGSPVEVANNGKSKIILLQRVIAQWAGAKHSLKKANTSYVLAVPRIDTAELSNAFYKYEQNKAPKSFIHVNMHVLFASQIQEKNADLNITQKKKTDLKPRS